jgi:phenylacetate-coenzyme A ligase PaaK-like adenylate-forming protein
MNEVEAGKRYEVVITSFYGQPLVRYRMFDIIEFVSLQDADAGIRLPQMRFVGRSGDFIDLAGFTGLIDEKLVWTAIVQTEIPFEEWVIRKESHDDRIGLHLYLEPSAPVEAERVRVAVNGRIEGLNPFYADYESLIEARPLEVTILSKGTFQDYIEEKAKAGADLAHLKPPHMNAADQDIDRLLALSRRRA